MRKRKQNYENQIDTPRQALDRSNDYEMWWAGARLDGRLASCYGLIASLGGPLARWEPLLACLTLLIRLALRADHLVQGKVDALETGDGLALPPTLAGLAIGLAPRLSAP